MTFSEQHEELILKYLPKFAAIESARSMKKWHSDIGAAFKTNRNGGRKPKEVPSRVRAQAVLRYKAGYPFSKIKEDTGLSTYALSLVLCQAGLRHFPADLLPLKACAIKSLMSRGKTNLEIAQEIEISEDAVQHWIKRFGLDQW